MIILNMISSMILDMILFINLRIWGLVIIRILYDNMFDIIVILRISKFMLYLFIILDNVLTVTDIIFISTFMWSII